jgi:hypothetical protein
MAVKIQPHTAACAAWTISRLFSYQTQLLTAAACQGPLQMRPSSCGIFMLSF